jgi:protein TonB
MAAESRAWRRQRRGTTVAAVIAVALHGAALAPFLLAPTPEVVVAVADAVEVAPLPEAVAPAPSESAAAAEPLTAAAPDALSAADAPPQPVQAEPPDEVPAPAPEAVSAAQPEPVEVAPSEPPPPEEVAEADPIEAVPPMEELAAVPPPPPPAPRPRPARPVPRNPPRVAPAAPPAETAATPPPPAAAAAPVARRPPASYVGSLLAALERHKTYPQSARSRRAEGTAVLRFAMRRSGHVVAWRIERSTGHDDLDDAVEQMIRSASPLPAPPEELPGDPVEMVVPVRFRLR